MKARKFIGHLCFANTFFCISPSIAGVYVYLEKFYTLFLLYALVGLVISVLDSDPFTNIGGNFLWQTELIREAGHSTGSKLCIMFSYSLNNGSRSCTSESRQLITIAITATVHDFFGKEESTQSRPNLITATSSIKATAVATFSRQTKTVLCLQRRHYQISQRRPADFHVLPFSWRSSNGVTGSASFCSSVTSSWFSHLLF